MGLEIVVIILVGVLLFQQWFFLRQLHKLIDKIMAGNYGAYVQTEAFRQEVKKPNGFNVPLPQDEGPSELDQLNAMLRPPL